MQKNIISISTYDNPSVLFLSIFLQFISHYTKRHTTILNICKQSNRRQNISDVVSCLENPKSLSENKLILYIDLS